MMFFSLKKQMNRLTLDLIDKLFKIVNKSYSDSFIKMSFLKFKVFNFDKNDNYFSDKRFINKFKKERKKANYLNI